MDTITQQIRAAITEERKRALRRIRLERDFARKITPTAAHRLKHLPYDPQNWAFWVTGAGDKYSPHKLTVRIFVDKLEGFKDPRLCAVLEPLCDAGEITTQDFPTSLCREYLFEYPSDLLIVVVMAYVRSDSPTCHMVAVGTSTRTITDIEYELHCD